MRGLLNLKEFCSIMGLWYGTNAHLAHTLTPIELVELRTPKRVPYPPQTISSVGVSHLSVGWHRQRQNNKSVGVTPSGVTRRFDPRSELNQECVVPAGMRMGVTFGWATEDETFNPSYGSVADGPGDLPRRLIND